MLEEIFYWVQDHLILASVITAILGWIDYTLIRLLWTGKIQRSRIPTPFWSLQAWKDEISRELHNFEVVCVACCEPFVPLILAIGCATLIIVMILGSLFVPILSILFFLFAPIRLVLWTWWFF